MKFGPSTTHRGVKYVLGTSHSDISAKSEHKTTKSQTVGVDP